METGEVKEYFCFKEVAAKLASGELVLRDVNHKSRIWTIYSKIEDLSGSLILGCVCCKICRKIFTFSKCASNLVKHKCYILKYVHKQQNTVSIVEAELPKLENSNSSFEFSDVKHSNNNLTKLITKCVIKNCRSYEMIQNDDFKAIFIKCIEFGAKFSKNIDIDKLLPSSQVVARNINEIYRNFFKRIQDEISALNKDGFGLAIHVWENNFQRKKFISLTIHFLKYNAITCRFLGIRPIEGIKCTREIILEKVDKILNDWNCKLSSKSLMVTSGCSNVLKSHTIPCISDLLNNALQKSIEKVPEVAELINSCIELLNYLNRKAINIFLEQSYTPGRWITLYKLLNSMAIYWVKIKEALKLKNEESQIKTIAIDHLKAVVKTLDPFEEAFCVLEKEDKASLHLVIVYLHELRKSCEPNCSKFEEYDFVIKLKENLLVHLDKIVAEDLTIFHKLALFLYPPTKKLRQYSDEEKNLIEAECIRLMKCFEYDVIPTIKEEPEFILICESKRRKIFSDFIYPETNEDKNEFIQQELQIYKMTRVINSEDLDIFCWWEQQKNNLPILYKLSRMIFATPASSISAQRIFTSIDSVLCDKLAGLDSSEMDIEQIAFVKFNVEQDELDLNV